MLGRRKKSTKVIALKGGLSAAEKRESEEIDRILAAEDFYQVLGLEFTPHWDAQEDAVREAYLDTSRRLNPNENTDVRLGKAAARLAEAYDTLCDDELRTKYNLDKGFVQPNPFGGGLLGLLLGLATQQQPGPRQGARRNNQLPPPQQGPRTTPEERRAQIEQQQRRLEEQHEEQQRNIREQGEQLARLRRQHQSGAIRPQRSPAPERPRTQQRPPPQRRPQRRIPPSTGGPGGYHQQYQGGRQTQGTTNLDQIEERFRQLMQEALGLGGQRQGQGQGQNGQNGNSQRQGQEEDYTQQMQILQEMGFTNEQQNLHALRQARGSVELAIDFMVQGGG